MPGMRTVVVCLPIHSFSPLPLPSLTICIGISHDIILAAANQIVSLGLQDAGYEYVNIDVRLYREA